MCSFSRFVSTVDYDKLLSINTLIFFSTVGYLGYDKILSITILPAGEGNGNPLQYSCLEKFHGWRSLVGYGPWSCKELDTTERLHFLSFYSSFWRGKWQPTPVFLLGESCGWRGLVGCSLCGCRELDMAKQLTHTYFPCYTVGPLGVALFNCHNSPLSGAGLSSVRTD